MKRGTRLTAVLTGKAREVGPQEAHARNVLAITGRIHRRDARMRKLNAELKRLRKDQRQDRTELRAVLQRDQTMTVDDERALEAAGHADAIDASNARHER